MGEGDVLETKAKGYLEWRKWLAKPNSAEPVSKRRPGRVAWIWQHGGHADFGRKTPGGEE